MALLPADIKKCLTCQRWAGQRRALPEVASIEYDETRPKGECVEGPWHGSQRSVRNACGRWVQWAALGGDAALPLPAGHLESC